MDRNKELRIFTVLFDAYLSYIALATLIVGWHNLHTQVEWTLGDWLINYRGGFIRRGLTGEFTLHCSSVFNLSPLAVVVILALLLYAILFYSTRHAVRRSGWSLWAFFSLISPATLAFGVLDSRGGFHKELIFLTGLASLLLFGDRTTKSWLLTAYVSVVTVVCVLSHEPLVAYMPYFFAALLLIRRSWTRSLRIAAIPFFLGLMCLILVVMHPGTPAMEQQICSSLQNVAPNICKGAIGYVAQNADFAHKDLLHDIKQYHYFLYYPIFALLSFFPLAMEARSLWHQPALRSSLRIVGGMSLLALAGSVVLFYFATDWGRWIHIHVFSILLLLLFIGRDIAPERQTIRISPIYRQWNIALPLLIATAIYVFGWSLPHYGDHPRFGYWSLFTHSLSRVTKSH